MTETIGKVKLNLDLYPGEDYYSDGAIEDELLKIAETVPEAEFQRVIEEKKSWPILYHFSKLRENIVEYLPFTGKEKVLEVGSGCGAITGVLSRKAKEVTCVDLSKKRSMVNAHRHKECENVCIHVGNFKDIEPTLPEDYDYICLIGVFEYARGYLGGPTPYKDFLNILKKHLSAGGRIVIAIENKYGMKYFAGATEDHLGTYFSGIENYREQGIARTFSRNGLERIFKECGFEEFHFYYPYPDYKFMSTLFSDRRLPGKGELSNNLRNFDRDRMALFDEKAAFDGTIEEELFPVFSNSYVAVLGKELGVVYAKYSNDRQESFRIKTDMILGEDGRMLVRKVPQSPKSVGHVKAMKTSYEKLSQRFQGSELRINPCSLREDSAQKDGMYAEFAFEKGTPLSEIMDDCIASKDMERFYEYFRSFYQRISYNKEIPVADVDLIFSNILVEGDTWTLIDYEWTFEKAADPRELAYRAIYCYLLEDEKRSVIDMEEIGRILSISDKDMEQYREGEIAFQKYVDGGRCSLAIMRDLIGRRILDPVRYLKKQIKEEDSYRVQVYRDCGSGYSEEDSYFVKDAYVEEHRIEMNLQVRDNVRMLRVDPAMSSGVCRILSMKVNGQQVDLLSSKRVIVNGKLWKEKEKDQQGSLTAIFSTQDPNINFSLEGLALQKENEISFVLEMYCLPERITRNLEEHTLRFPIGIGR